MNRRLALAALATACGSDAPSALPPDAAPDAGHVIVELPPVTLAPGGEVTDHWHTTIGGAAPLRVRHVRTSAETGLHHLGFFQVAPDQECLELGVQRFLFSTAGLIDWRLPDGYLVFVDPALKLCVQYHLLNASAQAATYHVIVTFETVPEGASPEARGAHPWQFETDDIAIPPRSEWETTFDCRFPEAATLINLGPHIHRRGRRVEVRWAGGARDGELIERWEGREELWEAPFRFFDPPAPLAAGEGVRVTCAWENDDDRAVGYGPVDEEEMCQVKGLAATGGWYVEGWARRASGCAVSTRPVNLR